MAWKRLGSQIVAQVTNSEVMLADVHLGVYYAIGGSGAEMWNAIDRGYSREQIVRRLESIYEASPETLVDAFTDFVDNLVDYDLIKPSGGPAEAQSTPQSSPAAKRPFVEPTVSRFKRTDPQLSEKFKAIKWQPASVQIAWKSNDQDVTVVQIEQGVSCKLTGIAKDIWLALNAGYTRQAMVDECSKHFATSAEQIASDYDRFIADLAQRGLIHPAASESHQITARPRFTAQTWEAPQVITAEDKDAAIRWITAFQGWEPATPRIAAEVIDNEVIIVDLKAGIYSTITGAGTVIWQALAACQLRDAVVNTLQNFFDVSADDATQEVDLVVRKIVESALVRPRNSQDIQHTQSELPIPAQKAPFERSDITSHADMEDVLRLDPVHDFGEYGWPNKG